MLESPEQLDLPQQLKDLILDKKCVAFVGSGLSAGCYLSWEKLVNDLCERCGSKCRVDEDSRSEEFLEAAQNAKNLAKDKYFAFLYETFGQPPSRTNLSYYTLLELPFHSYLTVNFDPLLAFAGRRASRKCTTLRKYPDLNPNAMGGRSIHYLHGLIEHGEALADGDIVLARDEFKTAYKDNGVLLSLLVSTLKHHPVVFVGCRLLEEVWRLVTQICKIQQQELLEYFRRKNIGRKPPQHFILVARPQVLDEDGKPNLSQSRAKQKEEERRYLGMGIKPVWYRALGSDHSQLWRALERLAELQPPKVSNSWEVG